MGMRLKPGKCRSFSVSRGLAKDVPFFIGDFRIPSIKDEDQKFLGRLLFFSSRTEETFNLIKSTFKEGLDRIDKSFICSEYKLWIYSHYFLPSKRFLLTVHTLTATQLKLLDTFTDQFIKKWSGLPKCATNALIHLSEGMGITTISNLYMETHSVSHSRTRLQGDTQINHVLDTTLQREQSLSSCQNKLRTTIAVEKIPHTGDKASLGN